MESDMEVTFMINYTLCLAESLSLLHKVFHMAFFLFSVLKLGKYKGQKVVLPPHPPRKSASDLLEFFSSNLFYLDFVVDFSHKNKNGITLLES